MMNQIREFLHISKLSTNTKKNYERYLNQFSNFTMDKQLQDVTQQDVIGFLNHKIRNPTFYHEPATSKDDGIKGKRAEDYKVSSLLTILIPIQSLFSYHDLENKVNWKKLKKKLNLRTERSPIVALTSQEVGKLLKEGGMGFVYKKNNITGKLEKYPDAYMDEITGKALISLLFSSGLRISEALNLRIEDIDFENKTLLVRKSKSKKFRTSIFDNRSKVLLGDLIGNRERGFVFNKRYSYIAIFKRLNQWKEQAKLFRIGSLSAHKFRHSFATIMKDSINLPELQQLMGHSSIGMTERYIHVNPQNIRKLGQHHPFDKIKGETDE